MMNYIEQTKELLETVLRIAKKEKKLTGFTIGSTAKVDAQGLYFTPVRRTSLMITAGVIVFDEKFAQEIASVVNGRVQYILVDAEKKIAPKLGLKKEFIDVEEVVREVVDRSKLWVYKGNDLSVDAVDGLLAQLTAGKGGISGKKIAILGAGNLGCKLALKLVERGARVFITRRDKAKLLVITKALNMIKPMYAMSNIVGMTDNEKAAEQADILIGANRGKPIITKVMIQQLAPDSIIIDIGKGSLLKEAFEAAERMKINVYRLDISAAFEGLIHQLWAVEHLVKKCMGRRQIGKECIVSGGLLGRKNEIVVDNINHPRIIYGVCDGKGDFIRTLDSLQKNSLKRLQNFIDRKK